MKLKSMIRNLLISLYPKWFNRSFCSTDGLWNDYFKEAEHHMDIQWSKIIFPAMNDFDFDTVLELAPGAGRNTEKLAKIARTIHAVDLNEYALEKLRIRFLDYKGACKIIIHKNNGTDLRMIDDGSITSIYCWDAAVHFDKAIIRDYMSEFNRVLKPGGHGLIHHSNLGDSAQNDITKNPHLRSNMSKELFVQYCQQNHMEVTRQIDVPWNPIVDCLSVFKKPA